MNRMHIQNNAESISLIILVKREDFGEIALSKGKQI